MTGVLYSLRIIMASPVLASATTQNTDLLDQMNASYDAHGYLSTAVKREQSRLLHLDSLAKRDVYKLQGQSLGVVYSADKSKFISLLTRIVVFSSMLVVGIVSATAQKFISRKTGVILGVSVMTITGVVLILMISGAATRRNSSWSRYYWRNTGVITPTS